jgi:hypothetical protein
MSHLQLCGRENPEKRAGPVLRVFPEGGVAGFARYEGTSIIIVLEENATPRLMKQLASSPETVSAVLGIPLPDVLKYLHSGSRVRSQPSFFGTRRVFVPRQEHPAKVSPTKN